MWHVTRDTWHVTRDMWHVTCDMWHVTRDTWHVICLGGWTFSQNFSCLAITVCYLWYYEDQEEKDESLIQSMNESLGNIQQTPKNKIDVTYYTCNAIGLLNIFSKILFPISNWVTLTEWVIESVTPVSNTKHCIIIITIWSVSVR